MDALSNTYALQQNDGAGAPVGDSAHLESLLAPDRTCAEMFKAARKLFAHSNVELEAVVDGSFHVVDSAQGDEPFRGGSDGFDDSELVERFEDDGDEVQSDGPDAESRFGVRPQPPDHPPPGYLCRTRSRVRAVKRNRRTRHRLRHVWYPWASHRRQVWE